MIFDELGLPRDTGSTDFQDSARLAGIMNTFSHPTFVPIVAYVTWYWHGPIDCYVRHPKEQKYDFSRDQAICLMAGLYSANQPHMVDQEYIKGKDWFSPSAKGHIARCQGKKSNWFQDAWLWLDVVYHIHVKPYEEPNQLLCMLMVADKKYLKYWVNKHPNWKKSISDYWCGWRQEPELADLMIKRIEALVP